MREDQPKEVTLKELIEEKNGDGDYDDLYEGFEAIQEVLDSVDWSQEEHHMGSGN